MSGENSWSDRRVTEAGQHGPGSKVAIPQDQVARAEGGPELLEEGVFTGAVGPVGEFEQAAVGQREAAHGAQDGETAKGAGAGRVTIGLTVGGGVGHGQAGAIEDFELPAMGRER